jgi:hypothetical protein
VSPQLQRPALDAAEARELVDRINATLAEVVDLIERLYIGRAWEALGYASWDELCRAEVRVPRLDRGERAELVLELRSAGMSTRAIGSAVGVGDATIRRDLATAPDDAVEPDTITAVDGSRRSTRSQLRYRRRNAEQKRQRLAEEQSAARHAQAQHLAGEYELGNRTGWPDDQLDQIIARGHLDLLDAVAAGTETLERATRLSKGRVNRAEWDEDQRIRERERATLGEGEHECRRLSALLRQILQLDHDKLRGWIDELGDGQTVAADRSRERERIEDQVGRVNELLIGMLDRLNGDRP